jgi:hypothetical protein
MTIVVVEKWIKKWRKTMRIIDADALKEKVISRLSRMGRYPPDDPPMVSFGEAVADMITDIDEQPTVDSVKYQKECKHRGKRLKVHPVDDGFFVETFNDVNYENDMKIDEALQHIDDILNEPNICEQCKKEHEQLKLWLEELIERRNKDKKR